MAQPEERLSRGLGSIKSVCDHIATELSGDGLVADPVNDLYDAICLLDGEERLGSAVMPIIASILNKWFRETGYLYSIDDNGRLSKEYFSSGPSRDLIASVCEL